MTREEEFEGWKRVAYQPEIHAGVAGGFDDKWKKWPVRIGGELVKRQVVTTGKGRVRVESSAGTVSMWINSGGALCAINTPGVEVEYVSATVPVGVLAPPDFDWRVVRPGVGEPDQVLLDVLAAAGACPILNGSNWVERSDIRFFSNGILIKQRGSETDSLVFNPLCGWRFVIGATKGLVKFVVADEVLGTKDALVEIDRVLGDLDDLQRMLV